MARVLIVETDPDLRLLAQEAVAELGYEAVVLENGAADDEQGHLPERLDVLLLGRFAGMGALVGRLRNHATELPVVCTGVTPAGEDVRALAPVAYLIKPYSLRALGRALDKALSQEAAR